MDTLRCANLKVHINGVLSETTLKESVDQITLDSKITCHYSGSRTCNYHTTSEESFVTNGNDVIPCVTLSALFKYDVTTLHYLLNYYCAEKGNASWESKP